MYRITKVLNHNTIIAVMDGTNKEYLIMGKGVGFGKKVTESIETCGNETVYSLQASSEGIDPVFMEIANENISQAMQMARAVRECIALVEQEVGRPIDVMSLSYNRLMNHVRNLVARVMRNEELKLSMNDYMSIKFPHAFQTAKHICEQVEQMLKCKLSDAEIGYLAMHIERVTSDETEN